ncbi:hypothetical protein KGQ19_31395 [Catenulispora sp. NL8]|uniref:Uncharacterized protein n=1 Tax=Catenulispora pinistramenti TaxID=2705254 RepID=A0ABS5KZN3_9ACTN|nr:hypothetical protein [Catenulispora pinistramenti]MBS2551384.1 hypothetical protein [Catenulispora pinistramenti]
MTDFADSLFEDLMAEHGAELTSATAAPTPARRRYTRPAWASAGTVAAAGAAVVGFTVFSGTASAYAVTDNHDGTVTVSVTKAEGISGANAKLHKMGASAVVLKATPGCPSLDSFATPTPNVGKTGLRMQAGPGGKDTVTIQAQGLPKNETMLIAFGFDGVKGQVGMVLTTGPVPACVSLPVVPPNGAVSGDGGGLHTQPGPGSAPALDRQHG